MLAYWYLSIYHIGLQHVTTHLNSNVGFTKDARSEMISFILPGIKKNVQCQWFSNLLFIKYDKEILRVINILICFDLGFYSSSKIVYVVLSDAVGQRILSQVRT